MANPTAYFEHAYYIGNYLSAIMYGVDLVLYFATLWKLPQRTKRGGPWKFIFIYSTILFVLLTIDIAVNAYWGEVMWIDKRDNPGVAIFIVEDLSIWYQIMGSATVIAMALLGDALLLHRLYMLWDNNIWVALVPGLVYCAALTLGILELVEAFKPGGFFLSGRAVDIGTIYYSITVTMNVLITSLICLRLFLRERLYRRVMVIIIESAAPYTFMGVLFLPFYAKHNNAVVALGQVWSKLTCIAPQMILYRVAAGTALRSDTSIIELSDIEFGIGGTSAERTATHSSQVGAKGVSIAAKKEKEEH